ncbi:MAG: HAD family hydrolase [Verrucomicrobia bacterium]|nr:HAD family hydrolase [Verrucomicrobiota bacterium]
MPVPRYRHVVWDWNGTLLDDVDYSIACMNGLLARRGLPLLDRARYHALFDFPVRDYYYRLGFDPARDPFERLSVEFISAYDTHRWDCRLHEDAIEVLAAVSRTGATQSILSAYRQETLHEIVGHFGLTPRFIRLIGLDNIFAHSKAELGRAWLAELGLPPAEVLLIGDTLHDLDVARHMGVDCVLVAAGHHPHARLRARHDRVVDTLAALRPGFISFAP